MPQCHHGPVRKTHLTDAGRKHRNGRFARSFRRTATTIRPNLLRLNVYDERDREDVGRIRVLHDRAGRIKKKKNEISQWDLRYKTIQHRMSETLYNTVFFFNVS